MKQLTLPARRTSGAPLAVGDSESQPTINATITIARTRYHRWVTAVHDRDGNLVEALSSAHTTENQARAAARNAYRAFADGQTVRQVIAELDATARYELAQALNRGNDARVAELNDLIDRFTSPEQRAADEAMLAGIAANMQAAVDRDENPPAAAEATLLEFTAGTDRPRTLADLKRLHKAGADRDRVERTGAAA